MFGRWVAGGATAGVVLLAATLIVLDIAAPGVRQWWSEHALTTDTVAGLIVVMITVLVVDQVVRMRQIKDRSRAIGAQAAIVCNQAKSAAVAVQAALNGDGDRDEANEEVRTYLAMLLIAAPVLIDAALARTFLEDAQQLGGELARALAATSDRPGGAKWLGRVPPSPGGIDRAAQALKASAMPLLRALRNEERVAVAGPDSDLAELPAGEAAAPSETV